MLIVEFKTVNVNAKKKNAVCGQKGSYKEKTGVDPTLTLGGHHGK